ncbi:MAG: DUF4177 domain-containing protein [Pseudomonadota bacterium]|nr:DUF4177 domain-containing protein [Pseudomonadota bacterium]
MSTQRFEYLVHETKNGFFKMAPDINQLSEDLNRLGNQGWELVTQLSSAGKSNTSLAFKRAR